MDEDFYITLIYKKLTGTISTLEQTQLADWLKASEENQLTEQTIALAWDQSENLSASPNVDLDKDFNALETRIKRDERDQGTSKSQEAKQRIHPVKWLSIAAGIAMLLVAGMFLLKSMDDKTKPLAFTELKSDKVTKTVVLSDGTKVKLNKSSQLKYPENFNSEERRVFLEGEAFFEVTHNPDQPFIVQTLEGTVKVLGTSFNVRAFPKEGKEEVQVATGRVEVEVAKSQQKIILTRGNKSVFDKENKTLEKVAKASGNNLYWYTQELLFVDTPIHKVLESLEKHFGVKMELENDTISNCPFSSKFKNADLQNIIATIDAVLGIETVKGQNNIYQMRGGKCE